MSATVQALIVFLPIGYLAASILYAMHFGGPDAPKVRSARRWLLITTTATHAILFLVLTRDYGGFPVRDAWSTASAMALVIAVLHGVISCSVANVGAALTVIGSACILQLGASAFGNFDTHSGSPSPGGYYIFHAVTSLFAASALVLSGIHGFLYLILFRRMREHRFGPVVERLPSLGALAKLMRRSAMAGFVLLGVGLNVGIAWAHDSQLQAFHYTDPWVLAMLAIWLHFGAVAFSSKIPGLNATRASYGAAFGLSVFVGAGLLSMIPHVSFHWGS